jgi:hypothetical protein
MKHTWRKDDDGSIDLMAWDFEYHHGPVCEVCGATPCINCTPDYDAEECPGPRIQTNYDRIFGALCNKERMCGAIWRGYVDANMPEFSTKQECLDWLKQPANQAGEAPQ